MMPKLSAVIVIAMALVVQGATLVERAGCPPSARKCATIPGSPNASDCDKAMGLLRDKYGIHGGTCQQTNEHGNHCQTLATYGTCKIEACGQPQAKIGSGPDFDCQSYLSDLLGLCKDGPGRVGGKVGGRAYPSSCNVDYNGKTAPTDDTNRYHLQFSHT